jgi:hypothetical protein
MPAVNAQPCSTLNIVVHAEVANGGETADPQGEALVQQLSEPILKQLTAKWGATVFEPRSPRCGMTDRLGDLRPIGAAALRP